MWIVQKERSPPAGASVQCRLRKGPQPAMWIGLLRWFSIFSGLQICPVLLAKIERFCDLVQKIQDSLFGPQQKASDSWVAQNPTPSQISKPHSTSRHKTLQMYKKVTMFEFSSLYCRLIRRALFTFSLCSQSGSTEVLRPLRVWHSWSKRTAGAKSSPEKMFLHCLTVWLTKQKCPLDRAAADSGQWLVTASYAHMHLLSFATTSTMQRSSIKKGATHVKRNKILVEFIVIFVLTAIWIELVVCC